MGDIMSDNSQFLIYQFANGDIRIDVRLEDETVWLTQAHMAELFGKNKRTISEHIRNIFDEKELNENSVVLNFRTTASVGNAIFWQAGLCRNSETRCEYCKKFPQCG